ncbi:anti-sigma factor [Agromyces sp. Marseille-P2726]|uniref:anti-sigma factor family protein n=1 Tax=Agromyces sp. Marseille-P2726 TaxID=2709132 RepID=UPI00156E6ACF|nr:zf-HC2 domain-containing protein [Agromyces sp. Marseille-P2726]
MNPDHSRYADWDSAYVLGALSPTERREYEEHVEMCDACRRSVAELTPMPGLLARLDTDRAEALLDEGADEMPSPRPELLDAVRREARRRSVRRSRTRVALLAAAALVVIAAVAVPLALSRPAADRQSVAFEAVVDAPVTATAVLTPVEWGTRIQLDCTYQADPGDEGPRSGWPYALVVVDSDGRSTEVSSWRAAPGATARLEAGSALGVDEIASLEIRAVATGDVLLRGVAAE